MSECKFTLPGTDWKEIVAEDEAEQFQALAREIVSMQDLFARKGDGLVRRGFHRKSHLGLKAEFSVLDNIPAYAKQGIFKEPETYPSWVRLSNGYPGVFHDLLPDLRGFAVKLVGVEGKQLLDGDENAATQDFITLNQCYIPARDAREFTVMSVATSRNILTAPFKIVFGLGLIPSLELVLWGLRLLRPVRSLATENYWSNLPIAFGPYAIKFKWQPRQALKSPSRIFPSRHYLREEFKQRLRQNDLCFDFMAQFYVDEKTTPIENGAYEWKESDAPYLKLAELRIRQRDLDSYQSRLDERLADSLSFNPWHGIEEHRPLGNSQRSRAVIYDASVKHRGGLGEPEE